MFSSRVPGAMVIGERFAILRGGLRAPKLQRVATFGDRATLDVPGSPRVILTPGHPPGSAVLHVASRNALFVGDALGDLRRHHGRSRPAGRAPSPRMRPRRWRPWPASKRSRRTLCCPGMAICGPAASRRRFGQYAKAPRPAPNAHRTAT
jgi:glyoxylase-like metal-dependent hydrolase (beta-lactamase superfamily II)